MNPARTLWWDATAGSLCYIDQTRLPGEFTIAECREIGELAEAIRHLGIRGAPALGVAGAYGIALSAQRWQDRDLQTFISCVRKDAALLRSTRPTAVNLGWGIDRVLQKIAGAGNTGSAYRTALEEAETIAAEDTASCHAIGESGASLLPAECRVLTHCNAGSLACSSWGTALGVVRSAVRNGKAVTVYSSETRPLLQGSRLTAWELMRDGIDVTVITDSTAASLMRKGMIDMVLVGADRITADAVFNKIGTYMHAVCASHHAIPFYVAAPLSTFDTTRRAPDVSIEERPGEEVLKMGDTYTAPKNAKVLNYSFDATPMDLITAIITEKGVLRPPFDLTTVI